VNVCVCFGHFVSWFVGCESSRGLGAKRLGLGAGRLGAGGPWVRSDW